MNILTLIEISRHSFWCDRAISIPSSEQKRLRTKGPHSQCGWAQSGTGRCPWYEGGFVELEDHNGGAPLASRAVPQLCAKPWRAGGKGWSVVGDVFRLVAADQHKVYVWGGRKVWQQLCQGRGDNYNCLTWKPPIHSLFLTPQVQCFVWRWLQMQCPACGPTPWNCFVPHPQLSAFY